MPSSTCSAVLISICLEVGACCSPQANTKQKMCYFNTKITIFTSITTVWCMYSSALAWIVLNMVYLSTCMCGITNHHDWLASLYGYLQAVPAESLWESLRASSSVSHVMGAWLTSRTYPSSNIVSSPLTPASHRDDIWTLCCSGYR